MQKRIITSDILARLDPIEREIALKFIREGRFELKQVINPPFYDATISDGVMT